MKGIEMGYDGRGRLIWAKGKARDIYNAVDDLVNAGDDLAFRKQGHGGSWFTRIIVRHQAHLYVGAEEPEIPETVSGEIDFKAWNTQVPPSEQWTFVLVVLLKSEGDEQLWHSHELTGDDAVEVKIVHRKP